MFVSKKTVRKVKSKDTTVYRYKYPDLLFSFKNLKINLQKHENISGFDVNKIEK